MCDPRQQPVEQAPDEGDAAAPASLAFGESPGAGAASTNLGEEQERQDVDAEKRVAGAAYGRSPAEPGAECSEPGLRGPNLRIVRRQPVARGGEAGTGLLCQEAGAIALAASKAGLGGTEQPLHPHPLLGRAEYRRGVREGASIGKVAPLRLEETGAGSGRRTAAGGALGSGGVAAELLELPVGATALDRGGSR